MLIAALAVEVTLVAGGLPAAAGLAVDSQGTPFVSTGTQVVRVVARNTAQRFVDTGGRPGALAFDAAGDLWVADAGRQALLKITPWGEIRVAAKGDRGPAQLAAAVQDEKGNRYVGRGAQVLMLGPDGKLLASHTVPGSEVTGLAFGGVDLKTLYVTERATGALYKLRAPHRSQRLPWEPDHPLSITQPPDGAILNRHDGEVTPRGLRIVVEGVSPGPVRVNGAPAEARDGRFRAQVVLAPHETRITAEGGGRRDGIRVFWDRASLPRYRFSVDDNIWFLRDLAQNAARYESIFDNAYLAFWREMHRKYGARIHFNIYWETEGFNLSQMPAKYRDEWRRNADWIRLTFHARANDPARPYLESTAERIRQDYRLVTREIERFAGKEVLSPFTTIHWGTTTRAAARALRQEGVIGLAGYFEARDELPTVCYYLPLAQWTWLAGRDYWKDTAEDLLFVRHDMVVNSFKLEEIVPRLEKLAADPHQSEVLELMIHEQYFSPGYVAYQPDFRQKVERALEWVTRRGYRPVFFAEGFLGGAGSQPAAGLPPGALAPVSHLHPRVFVRHDAARVGKGTTAAQLRARLRNPAYARWRAADPGRGAAGTMERAARYLETGDAADLAAVRDFLATHTFSYEKNDVGGFLAGAEMAAAFDWVYDGLSPSDRSAALANIVATAESSHRFLRRGGADINHNYTYMALSTVAVCGLVLEGEPEPYGSKAAEYLATARQLMEAPGRVIDTWNAREGAWAEGSHYTFHETLRTLALTLQAFRSASDTDYFERIDMARAGRFLMACTRPDMTFERTGDTSANRVQAALTVPLTVEMLAAGLGDAKEAARLRSFSRALLAAYGDEAVTAAFGWGMRMFYDPRARIAPSYQTLPLALRLGAGSYEHIMLRNGFGADSTLISIVAGDHFTDHQHFDKGQFLIYHRGGLAVDSGAYEGMYKPGQHTNEYAPRTLAHNCLLVYDPEERWPKGYTNDGGQRVLRGLQHHGTWPEYVAHRDREHLNTAEVRAFEADPAGRYHYLHVDLKGAYSDKVTRYDRQFVYLPGPDYLVIYDRVSAARAEMKKRWLLHFQEQPEIDGARPEAGVRELPGARLTVARRSGGLLFVHTLLPAERTVVSVGGPGYEFYNAFSGVNYPLARVSPASAARESGAWRIEVAPQRPALDDQFLHVLEMRHGSEAKPTETRLIAAEGVAGAHLLAPRENQVVLFAATLPLAYQVTTTAPASHLLAGLPPGLSVAVEVSGRRLLPLRVSPQGVLAFRDGGTGLRRIVVRVAGPR